MMDTKQWANEVMNIELGDLNGERFGPCACGHGILNHPSFEHCLEDGCPCQEYWIRTYKYEQRPKYLIRHEKIQKALAVLQHAPRV